MPKLKCAVIKPLTNEEVAYLAGILDGEGSISIVQQKVYGTERLTYNLVVSISSTDQRLVNFIQQTTGIGLVNVSKRRNEKHKPAYKWNTYSNQAGQFIDALYPYLIIKIKQATIAKQFISSKLESNEKLMPSQETRAFNKTLQDGLYKAIKLLNSPNIQTDTTFMRCVTESMAEGVIPILFKGA